MPSPVWHYFRKMGKDSLCVACGKMVTSTNTTNMWAHLERYHSKIHAELKKKKYQKAEEDEVDGDPIKSSASEDVPTDLILEPPPPVTKDTAETICQQPKPMSTNEQNPANSSGSKSAGNSANNISSALSEAPVPKSMVQTVLGQRFVKTTKAQAERITMAIAYFIAVACVAYSIVENTGFRYLLNVLAPNYHVPSRKVFSHDRVPKLHQATKKIIIEEIKEADHFTITTDGWTSTNSHKFIAVTLSFINENWKLISRVLACHDLNISNTGENIKCLIDEVLCEFKIEKPQVAAGVSDRGSNCICAINLLGFDHVPCFAHAVNNKMEEMLKLDFIAPTLQKIKNIFNKLSRSKIAKNYLESCQKAVGLKPSKMPSSCETRWWSEKKQFNFVIDYEMALYKFVTTYDEMNQSDLITPDDVARIKAILLVMEPMEKYVTTLGSEKIATASIIVPLIHKLERIFAKFKFHDAVASFGIKKFFRLTPKFFADLYIEEKSLLEMATYLDPRFKDCRRPDLEVILKQEIRELQANPRENGNSSMEKKNVKTKKKSALEELFEETDDETSLIDVAEHELDLYHSQLKIPITEDPLYWWKNRATVFPYLSVLAKKYLCIPATSVLSERVFSSGGRVITKETYQITDEHAEDLIFLHMNKDIVPHNA